MKTVMTESLNKKQFSTKGPVLVGVLNRTPDSFSDGGINRDDITALKLCESYLRNGFEIIDVGGESTRPGALPVSEDEELSRVIPIIEKIRAGFPELCISIDTTKSGVAREALASGVEIINDISGLSFDPEMETLVLEKNPYVVIGHTSSRPEKCCYLLYRL